jgi:hypothetical protein
MVMVFACLFAVFVVFDTGSCHVAKMALNLILLSLLLLSAVGALRSSCLLFVVLRFKLRPLNLLGRYAQGSVQMWVILILYSYLRTGLLCSFSYVQKKLEMRTEDLFEIILGNDF